MIKHYNIQVFGIVQGVNFRTAARDQAKALGITGFAKNTGGNSVYIEGEGEEASLQAFIRWCNTGTKWSRVERLEVSEGPVQNFTEFKVKRSFLW